MVHKKIAGQRRCFHEAEVEWLKCIDPEERRRRREVYLNVRRAYAREVKRAKEAWEEKEQAKLEELVKHPKQWWKGLKKLKVMDKWDTRIDVSNMRDVDGDVKQDKEAVEVWKNHFEKLLNVGQPSEGERVLRGQGKQNNSLLNEDLMMQEVV